MTDYNPEDVTWFDEKYDSDSIWRKIELQFHWKIVNPLRDLYYKVKYTLFPSKQFHTVRPRTLEVGYHDQDQRILHCVMELLCQYIEECEACGQDWDKHDADTYTSGNEHEPEEMVESTREQIRNYQTLKAIEQWWKNDWPRRGDIDVKGNARPERPGRSRMGLLPSDNGGLSRQVVWDYEGCTAKQYQAWIKKTYTQDEQWEKLAEKHLVTVMKLRRTMWV